MKKLLAVVLCVAMLVSLLPMMTFAADETIINLATPDKGVTLNGTWSDSTTVKNYDGGKHLWAVENDASYDVVFQNLKAGNYEVYVWKTIHDNTSANMKFTITHNGKTSNAGPVSMKTGEDGWELLGIYDFSGKGDEKLHHQVVNSDGNSRATAIKIVATTKAPSEGTGAPATTAPSANPSGALTSTPLAKDAQCLVLVPKNFSQLGTWTIKEDGGGAYGGSYIVGLQRSPEVTYKPADSKPAIAKVSIPADGNYTVWGRSKDFATNSPGTRFCNIQLGTTLFDTKLGAHGQEGYAWTKVGSADYKKGDVLLGLMDTSANYARIDVIIITNDSKFVPSNDEKEIKAIVDAHALKEDATKTTETKMPDPVQDTPSPTPTPTAKPTPTPTVKPTATPTPTPKPFQIPAGVPTQKDRPADEIAVKLNDVYLVFKDDSKPFTENDRTLVPFRAIFEAFGCEIGWDEATQVASGKKQGVTVELTIGKTDAKVNGKIQALPDGVAANTYNDRTFVPLRFIANALGAEVGWDEKTSTVLITMK